MRRCTCRKCGKPWRSHTNGRYFYYVGSAGGKYSPLYNYLPKAQERLIADPRPHAELVRVWVMRFSENKQYDIIRDGKWVSEYEGYYGAHSGMNEYNNG